MITGIDIKLEPVPMSTTGSGEMFKLRLKQGFAFITDIDYYTTVSTSDANGVVTSENFPNYEKFLTVSEVGNEIQEVVFKLPLRNIRYIQCYYE